MMTMTGSILIDMSSFETDLNGWTTGGMDQPFVRLSGSTQSWSTGPQGATDGSYYVYAETSGLRRDFRYTKIFVNAFYS